MNKDAILATVIGFVVGLFITGLILIGPKFVSLIPKINFPTISIPTKGTVPETPPPSLEFTITIDSPLEGSIETTHELLVSGTTSAGSTVIIQTDADTAVIIASDDGKYAGKIALIEGNNDLTVTSYLKDKQANRQIVVYYTPEEF